MSPPVRSVGSERFISCDRRRDFIDRLRVDLMLLMLDSFVKGHYSVISQDRNTCLQDNFTAVHAGIDKMHRAPGFADPRIERLFPCFKTRKSGQQGGVDVDDSAGKGIQQG